MRRLGINNLNGPVIGLVNSSANKMNVTTRSALLPVTYLQDYLCTNLSGPDGTDAIWRSLTLSWAWRISPSVDLRRLDRAFQALQMRHDVFRLAFVPTKAGWRARMHEKPRARVNVIDIGPVDDAAREHAITSRVAPKRHLTNDSLVSLEVLRFGDDDDVILFQINHMLTDGYGAIIVVEDLMSLFLGLPVPGAPMGFVEYMDTCFRQSAEQIAAGWEYWRHLVLPPPPPVNIGLVAKGLDPENLPAGQRIQKMHSQTLDAAATRRSTARSNALGCTDFALVSASFYGAVRDISGAEEMNFATILGRNDSRLSRFAGCHIDLLEMVCRPRAGRGVGDQARALHQQIRDGISHLPHPSAIPGSALTQDIKAQGGHSNRFQVRVGHFEKREQRSRLGRILAPKAGFLQLGKYKVREVPIKSAASSRELAVVLSSEKGNSRLDFTYDTAGFTPAEIADFADRMVAFMQGGD